MQYIYLLANKQRNKQNQFLSEVITSTYCVHVVNGQFIWGAKPEKWDSGLRINQWSSKFHALQELKFM